MHLVDRMSGGKLLLLVVLAGVANLSIPVAGAIWEIVNEPLVLPDGRVDDGAERGSAVFLLFFLWPLLAISFLYHWWLAKRAATASGVFRSIYIPALVVAAGLAIPVAIAFYQSGLVVQLQALLITFSICATCMLPGALVIQLGATGA